MDSKKLLPRTVVLVVMVVMVVHSAVSVVSHCRTGERPNRHLSPFRLALNIGLVNGRRLMILDSVLYVSQSTAIQSGQTCVYLDTDVLYNQIRG